MNIRLIHIFLLSISGIFLLSTPFIDTQELANGLVSGKVCWFHLAMLFVAISALFVALTQKIEKVTCSFPDLLLLLFIGIVLAAYNWVIHPEPEKLLFAGQLAVLWFLLRYSLTAYPALRPFFLFILMLTGLTEAIWGMQQLHGYTGSNHSLFRLTGSFFNPGPYSGYIAAILPICLWTALCFRLLSHYFAWICVGAILVVLPAGMSRSAWIAAAVSCGWVYWAERVGWAKSKEWISLHYKTTLIVSVIALTVLTGAMGGIYQMKKGSADGRLLMWKITAKAIARQPVTGTGLGGFPAGYAEAQAEYFASGKGTETEKLVAGCPEYAFNEYLHIGLEQGIVGLLVFVCWIGSCFYLGIRNRQIGASGGILALAVFAGSSYPLQLPEFWVVLVFLGAIAVSGEEKECHWTVNRLLIVVLAAGGIGLFWLQKDYYEGYKQWNRMKMLYTNKAYAAVSEDYEKRLPMFRHNPEFLFEAAMCMNKTEQYVKANKLLERASLLSTDPMIYYIRAKNEQALGHYKEAEQLLLHAINILPERIYPYFLLAKLYAEPCFYAPDKLREAASAVLTKEPKVQSTAIREMREEVKKIIQKTEQNE